MKRLRNLLLPGSLSVVGLLFAGALAIWFQEHRNQLPALQLDEGRMEIVGSCLIPAVVGASVYLVWFTEDVLSIGRWEDPRRVVRFLGARIAVVTLLIVVWIVVLSAWIDGVALVALRNTSLTVAIGAAITATGHARFAPLGGMILLISTIFPGAGPIGELVGYPSSSPSIRGDLLLAIGCLLLTVALLMRGGSGYHIATIVDRPKKGSR